MKESVANLIIKIKVTIFINSSNSVQTIGDPLSTATEPNLKQIVKEIQDWYTSFGQNQQFLHLYSA